MDNRAIYFQIIPLILLIALMYFMLIRPQKKKEREVNAMRSSIKVGDSIVTIGGICGKVVKVKEDSIVIQVGADKVKFEMMKWSVSQIVTASETKLSKGDEERKARPKKLKKAEPKKDEVLDVETEPVEEEKVAAEKPADEVEAVEADVEVSEVKEEAASEAAKEVTEEKTEETKEAEQK